jgi:hypothetical protein
MTDAKRRSAIPESKLKSLSHCSAVEHGTHSELT